MVFLNKIRPNVLVAIAAITAITILVVNQFFGVTDNLVLGAGPEAGTVVVNVEALTFLIALSNLIVIGLSGLVSLGNTVATDPEPNPIIEYEKVRKA